MIQSNAQTLAAYLPTPKKYTIFSLVLLYFLFPALESSPGFIPQAELLFAQRDELREEDFGEILLMQGGIKQPKKQRKGYIPIL